MKRRRFLGALVGVSASATTRVTVRTGLPQFGQRPLNAGGKPGSSHTRELTLSEWEHWKQARAVERMINFNAMVTKP